MSITFEWIEIPYGLDDHPIGHHKMLLTSRGHDVLSKDKCIHKYLHVQHLCEEEAQSSF